MHYNQAIEENIGYLRAMGIEGVYIQLIWQGEEIKALKAEIEQLKNVSKPNKKKEPKSQLEWLGF